MYLNRYVECSDDSYTKSYRVTVVDKYIKKEGNSYTIPSISSDFEKFVRDFFINNYDIVDTGYSNSVVTLNTWKEEYLSTKID